MKKDVYIKIKSLQKTENGDNKGEMSVIGTLLYKDSKHIIEYVENNEETGPEETTITVSEDNTVSIVRRGQFSSEMMVEKGKRHHTFYKTPYGELTMGIYGNQVYWGKGEDGAYLEMVYTLDFNNGFVSENKMEISIDYK